MDNNKILQIMTLLRDKVTQAQSFYIAERLRSTDDNAYAELLMLPYKSFFTTVLLGLFLGFYGINRFYIGDKLYGFIKLIFGISLTAFSLTVQFLTLGNILSPAIELIDVILAVFMLVYTIFNIVDIFICVKDSKKTNYNMIVKVLAKYPQTTEVNSGDIFGELQSDVITEIYPDVFKK